MLQQMRSGRPCRALLTVGVIGALGVLVGCSSSSSSNTSPTGSSNGGSGGTTAAQIAAAKAYVDQHGNGATAIAITTPLDSKPTPGKTIVLLKGDTPSNTDYYTTLQAAAPLVGWTVKAITFSYEDPSTLITAMKNALRLNPAAVVLGGSDPSLWASEVPAYEEANVPLITIEIAGNPTMTSPIAAISGEKLGVSQGTLIANWLIDDSKGKANALFINIPAYPIFRSNMKSFLSTLKVGCSTCKATVLDINVQQVAKNSIPSLVVAAIRKDPSINYVMTEDGIFVTGLPAQLAAAGLAGKVTIAGTYASEPQLTDILAGKVSTFTPQSADVEAYMALDAALRISEKMQLPTAAYDAGPSPILLNKGNIGTPTNSYNVPTDFEAQFQKLWHVS